MSFLTNILVDGLSEDCADGDIQQVLSELLQSEGGVFQFCLSFPNVRMFLAFPNIRLRPSWFGRQRSAIIRALHQFMESWIHWQGPDSLYLYVRNILLQAFGRSIPGTSFKSCPSSEYQVYISLIFVSFNTLVYFPSGWVYYSMLRCGYYMSIL